MQTPAPMPVQEARSVRPKEAAELLGISEPTLHRYARLRPGFPAKRKFSPGVTVFLVAELIAWRDAQKVAAQ